MLMDRSTLHYPLKMEGVEVLDILKVLSEVACEHVEGLGFREGL